MAVVFLCILEILCKLFALVQACITVSCITITVLAVERYHALLKPFRNGLLLREDNIKKAIAYIWGASVLESFPLIFFKEWSKTYETCIGLWTLHLNQGSKAWVIFDVVIYLFNWRS